MPRHHRGGSIGRTAAEQPVQGAGPQRLPAAQRGRGHRCGHRPGGPRLGRGHRDRGRGRRDQEAGLHRHEDPPSLTLGHADLRLPAGRLRVPQLRRDDRRDQPDRRRPPRDRPQDQLRHLLRGPRPDRHQDQRQRRHGRERARGAVHPPPARPGAPDRRDGALHPQPAHRRLRHRRQDHRPGELARDLDHAGPQPRRRRVRHRLRLLPLLAQEPAAQLRLLLGGHRPQPQLGLPVGLLRRLLRLHLQRHLPGRGRRVGTRGQGGRRLGARPGGRRRAADQVAHRLAHLRRADPVALRLHQQRHRPRPDPGRPRRVRGPGPEHGLHQQLHPRAGQRPLHHRRLDRRLDVGRPQDLQLHLRDVSDRVPGLLPPRRADRPADDPQPGGRAPLPGVLRLRLPDHRQGVAVLRHRDPAGDGLLRRVRDGDRLDRQPRRHRHRHPRPVGAR
ncbi:hypothetical protein Aros01_07391 [Streptosporangium roseum]